MLWQDRSAMDMSHNTCQIKSLSFEPDLSFLKEKSFIESKVTMHYDFSTNDQCNILMNKFIFRCS